MSERFGPYRLVRRIATGGMAEVFLAVQTGIEGFEREVVIKRILPHRARDQEFATMFLDEARLVARLSHPNIAQIYDLGHVGETFYIAMEYVRGPNLARILDVAGEQGDEGLPPNVAVPIVAALCEGLHYVHTRTDEGGNPLSIVHRDVNPKNVIISYEGAVKLIDFGIAKASSQVYETRTGVIKGTYGYMAPEQVTRRRNVEARSDLFALGVLAYEMTTGVHPFDAPDEVAVLSKLVRGIFKPPRELRPGYPPDLERLVLSCLSAEPETRPASARELLTRLERFACDHGIPLSMSRIADYVRLQVPPDEQVDQLAPRAAPAADGEGTAMVSKRLASRADEDVAALATSLLRPSRPQPKPAPAPAPASARGESIVAMIWSALQSVRWPWRTWARRQRVIAAVSASIVLVVSIGVGALLAAVIGGSHGAGDLGGGSADPFPRPPVADPWPTADDLVLPDARGGDNTVVAEPRRLLHVESDPDGAQIFIGGAPTGLSTPADIPVPAGQDHVWVRVELAGFVPEEREVSVVAGAALFQLTGSQDLAPPVPNDPSTRLGPDASLR